MDPFEYIVVISSLILGLGIAQILTGVADIVTNIRSVKLSLPHTILVIVVFLVHIQDWWHTYSLMEKVEEWNLLNVIVWLLLFPILLFTLARLLFPTGLRSHDTDLNKYYFDQWPWFFSVFSGIILISILQNVFVSGYSIYQQIPLIVYFLVYILFVLLQVKNKLFHTAFHIIQLITWIVFILTDDMILVIK